MARHRSQQVWPTLRARDARALIKFLVDAFGFEETVVYADGDVVHHAQLSWPEGGGIMLGSVRAGQRRRARPARARSAPTWSPTSPTRCTSGPGTAGAQITAEPHDTDYGSRDFAARDPEGNRWSFGTYRGEPRKG